MVRRARLASAAVAAAQVSFQRKKEAMARYRYITLLQIRPRSGFA
jgi:hypothetical protein